MVGYYFCERIGESGCYVAKGPVFAPLREAAYFMRNMRVAEDRLGIEWPNRVDFSADGLRFRAFPDEAEAELTASQTIASNHPPAATRHG